MAVIKFCFLNWIFIVWGFVIIFSYYIDNICIIFFNVKKFFATKKTRVVLDYLTVEAKLLGVMMVAKRGIGCL